MFDLIIRGALVVDPLNKLKEPLHKRWVICYN